MPPYSKVLIDNIICTVVEIGRDSLSCSYGVTSISIPDTVTRLMFRCFSCLSLKKPIIIPASVIEVESFFVENMNPDIIFCGTKEPEMTIYGGYTGFISNLFTGKVIVPLEYDPSKTTFCKKNIERSSTPGCPTKAEKRMYEIRKLKNFLFSIVSSNTFLTS